MNCFQTSCHVQRLLGVDHGKLEGVPVVSYENRHRGSTATNL